MGRLKRGLYNSWQLMKTRCFCKKDEHYKNYGGRGITVCERWLGENGFKNFYEDMGDRPVNRTLDRIDNNRGYYKGNCRWATKKEQGNNKRTNVLLSFGGTVLNITQWAEKLKMSRGVIYSRLNLGWSVEKTLSVPVISIKKGNKLIY